MNKIKNKLTLIVLLLFASIARSQVAVVDTKRMMDAVVGIEQVRTKMNEINERYSTAYTEKSNALNIQKKLAEDLANKNTPEAKQAQEKYEQLQGDFQKYVEAAEKKINIYKDMLFYPSMEKINRAINIVAERRHIMQVMDLQLNNFAYINPESDITDEVILEIKKLEVNTLNH